LSLHDALPIYQGHHRQRDHTDDGDHPDPGHGRALVRLRCVWGFEEGHLQLGFHSSPNCPASAGWKSWTSQESPSRTTVIANSPRSSSNPASSVCVIDCAVSTKMMESSPKVLTSSTTARPSATASTSDISSQKAPARVVSESTEA